MDKDLEFSYNHIRSGGTASYEVKRGLIAVWGKEAVQFLDGLITNDMKTLVDGTQMLAAFPSVQGRLLAVVRVVRQGDRFLFETEEATREKVFQNLFRFTYAGDFFVEDLSEGFRYFEVFGPDVPRADAASGGFAFTAPASTGHFVPVDLADAFPSGIPDDAVQISDELYEVLRIENGIPLYGVDMDETTIVPELGLDGLISYNKGCYIGQEIIARIHFRGHVAKQLAGVVLSDDAAAEQGVELTSVEGKNAGRITSLIFSPGLEKTIALAYVRYDNLGKATKLRLGGGFAEVTTLPFLE